MLIVSLKGGPFDRGLTNVETIHDIIHIHIIHDFDSKVPEKRRRKTRGSYNLNPLTATQSIPHFTWQTLP